MNVEMMVTARRSRKMGRSMWRPAPPVTRIVKEVVTIEKIPAR